MAIHFRQFRIKFFGLMPLMLLFFISFNGNSIVDLKFFTINIMYILVYFWTLRQPDVFGYGLIFISGLITDVVYGLPMGVSSLSFLTIAGVAAYVRFVTVRITLLNDWISFIPALLITNLVYFISLYASDYSISYLYIFTNSVFTFISYPIFWGIFTALLNIIKN